MNLTPNQTAAVDSMPATAQEIADTLDYETTSGVYKLLSRAESRDPNISLASDENGVWDVTRLASDGGTASRELGASTPQHRVPTAAKQSITKEANDFLAGLETDLRERLAYYEPTDATFPERPGARDMVMFRTDDHFGGEEDEVSLDGETVVTFDSDVAEERVFQHLDALLENKARMEAAGYTFDTGHLLLNGDHVTNESIYENQPHYIDENLREQVARVSRVYVDVVRTLSEEFPAVQVVCQHGNHGELRAKGASNQANADDLFYDALDLALRQSDVDNVKIVTNQVDTHTEFRLRGHRGYMRHGQDGLGHIGTNSGVKRWQSWLLQSADQNDDTGWDIGYWAHFHELKWEPVMGRPVLMGGTLQPTGDYENSLGIAPGRPGAWIHTVSDDEPVDWIKPVYFS